MSAITTQLRIHPQANHTSHRIGVQLRWLTTVPPKVSKNPTGIGVSSSMEIEFEDGGLWWLPLISGEHWTKSAIV